MASGRAGPIEDYGDADQLIADGEFESQEMFIWDWEQEFPDEAAWYELSAVEDKENGYRAISLSHRLVIVQDRDRQPRDYLSDISAFVQWLVDSVKECIEMLRNGTYNVYIREHLPPQYRVGTLRRKDYSLGVVCDGGGYWLRLTENVGSCAIETVRFYLALCRAGVPVFLTEAAALAERLAGTELIGVVPEDVTPVHCERYFHGQHIISFINLSVEDREELAPLCSWQPIDEVLLDI